MILGCGPKIIFDDEALFVSALSYQDTIHFEFEIVDTLIPYDIVLSIEHDNSYDFQNAYFKLFTTFPNGQMVEDITSFDLKKPNGMTNGACSGQLCKVPFLIQDNTFFKSLGTYGLKITQYSRVDSLAGIESIGLKIIEAES